MCHVRRRTNVRVVERAPPRGPVVVGTLPAATSGSAARIVARARRRRSAGLRPRERRAWCRSGPGPRHRRRPGGARSPAHPWPPPCGPLRSSFPSAVSTAASNVRQAALTIASSRRSSAGSTGAASAEGRAPGRRNRSWHRRAIAPPHARRTPSSADGTPLGRRAAAR